MNGIWWEIRKTRLQESLILNDSAFQLDAALGARSVLLPEGPSPRGASAFLGGLASGTLGRG